jgi:hypothetical protein
MLAPTCGPTVLPSPHESVPSLVNRGPDTSNTYRSLEVILAEALEAAEQRGDDDLVRQYQNFVMEGSVDL